MKLPGGGSEKMARQRTGEELAWALCDPQSPGPAGNWPARQLGFRGLGLVKSPHCHESRTLRQREPENAANSRECRLDKQLLQFA
ncbi:unnamed protein product [Rangifer tarandus platyrhynchus]|uniref:Uncharacterized protein n=3 Tax=Rangifer tarandus platyrhynchus TaxID=3082113 RepID=A0AC59ZE33_RANTA|nr:unnamed protein product [Rangifer tarandus platyrhynchus]CAI9704639.1 unnamed protein product [Rangifer tarandus platyrhynchus]